MVTKKPTYEELEQRVKELEKEALERDKETDTIHDGERLFPAERKRLGDGPQIRVDF